MKERGDGSTVRYSTNETRTVAVPASRFSDTVRRLVMSIRVVLWNRPTSHSSGGMGGGLRVRECLAVVLHPALQRMVTTPFIP